MRLKPSRPASNDGDLDSDSAPPRVYGGHPSPLAGEWARVVAMSMIKAARPCAEIAETLGYQGVSAFSDAFRRTIGMRPREFARSIGAPKPKRVEGRRVCTRRAPPYIGAKPLPRFDAKSRAKKKAGRKKRAS